MTNDNGQELGRDDFLAERLGVPIYVCTPSSPWQRGSVENFGGWSFEGMQIHLMVVAVFGQ